MLGDGLICILVKSIHHKKALPDAGRILACAAREGLHMARAEPAYQSEQYRKFVPWSVEAVNELRIGLRACRVLKVHKLVALRLA